MQKRLTEQGLRFLEEGQLDKAGQILSLLIKSFPENADAHHMLGIIELEKGSFDSAYILVNTAIDLAADNPMFYNTLGNIELHRKNINTSEKAFLKAIELAPEKIEFKYNLAHFYLTQNKYDKAIDYYYFILHTNPTHYLSIRGITVCYLFSGETEIALEHANEWVKEYGNYDEAHYYQGLCLYAMNDITGALAAYDKALEIVPTNQDVLTAIGACYRALGNFNIAETYLHNSLTLDSNNPTAIYHLACIKLDNGETDSAHDLFINAIKLNNLYAEPVCGLGCIELAKGNETAALVYFNRADKIEPSNLRSKLLIATTLLKLQLFKDGWLAYNKFTNATPAIKTIAAWNGEPLDNDQVLLVWASNKNDELAHQILFSSMLIDLQHNVKNVIVLCNSRLAPVLKLSFPSFKIISGITVNELENNTHGITKQIALNCLGQFYRLDIADFNKDKTAGYLTTDSNRRQYYISKYAQLFPGKKLIGISWKSISNTNSVEHLKSSHLSAWQELLSTPNCQFISLQAGDIDNEVNGINDLLANKLYLDPEVKLDNKSDLAEVCAQASALDLIISLDNYVAHLAGALGLDVYTLLPVQAEWYWFKDLSNSVFYPSMSLLRQTTPSDWAPALKNIAKII